MYPSVSAKVPIYNWKIEYQECSMRELQVLKKLDKPENEKDLKEAIFKKLVKWDATFPDGSPIPFTSEGLYDLPNSAMEFVYQIVLGLIKPQKDDESKNISTS
jgi:hypothetical protein